jgi:hypothetical protein
MDDSKRSARTPERSEASGTNLIARREVLRGTFSLGLALPILAACGKSTPKELRCDDTTGMPKATVEKRATVKYIDKATDPQKQCNGCKEFVDPTKEGMCGTCKQLDNTAVAPGGYCTLWAAKPAPPT